MLISANGGFEKYADPRGGKVGNLLGRQSTEKRDVAPVRRPGGREFVGWIMGKGHRCSAVSQLEIDIKVGMDRRVLCSVPRECHLVAVGREARHYLGARITREGNHLRDRV